MHGIYPQTIRCQRIKEAICFRNSLHTPAHEHLRVASFHPAEQLLGGSSICRSGTLVRGETSQALETTDGRRRRWLEARRPSLANMADRIAAAIVLTDRPPLSWRNRACVGAPGLCVRSGWLSFAGWLVGCVYEEDLLFFRHRERRKPSPIRSGPVTPSNQASSDFTAASHQPRSTPQAGRRPTRCVPPRLQASPGNLACGPHAHLKVVWASTRAGLALYIYIYSKKEFGFFSKKKEFGLNIESFLPFHSDEQRLQLQGVVVVCWVCVHASCMR
jgi:hypothetical protein